MAGVINFNSYLKRDASCQVKTFDVSLVAIQYHEDTSDMAGLTLKLPSTRRFDVWFHDEDFPACLSQADQAHFEAFLVKGKRYRIRAYACGAGGRSDLSITSIEIR